MAFTILYSLLILSTLNSGTLIHYRGDLFIVQDGDQPDGKINCRMIGFQIDDGTFTFHQSTQKNTPFDPNTVVDVLVLQRK